MRHDKSSDDLVAPFLKYSYLEFRIADQFLLQTQRSSQGLMSFNDSIRLLEKINAEFSLIDLNNHDAVLQAVNKVASSLKIIGAKDKRINTSIKKEIANTIGTLLLEPMPDTIINEIEVRKKADEIIDESYKVQPTKSLSDSPEASAAHKIIKAVNQQEKPPKKEIQPTLDHREMKEQLIKARYKEAQNNIEWNIPANNKKQHSDYIMSSADKITNDSRENLKSNFLLILKSLVLVDDETMSSQASESSKIFIETFVDVSSV